MPTETKTTKRTKRPFAVRNSKIHGRGVFATDKIPKGTRLIEYTGEVITWKIADRRYADDGEKGFHTFLFDIDGKKVIDAAVGGNASRWINHACEPNCESDETDGRVFIKALRRLKAGEELFYDYRLTIDERYTPSLKKQYACRCGSPRCRGTMLSPKR